MKLSSGYLRNGFYDHTLIFGITLIAMISGGVVLWKPELFLPILIIDLWFLGYHHVIATFTKLAGTKSDREENKFLIYYLPIFVLAGVFTLYQIFGIWMIVTIYFFWQWYHYTRQSYGISVFYRRKGGFETSKISSNLDYMALWAMPIWGLVNRCSQGWSEFLFLPFWRPDIPPIIAEIVGVIACNIVFAWLVCKIFDWSKGNLSYGFFAYNLSHHALFATAYVLIEDITFGWLVVNIWHNAQYILFVWLFNQNRFQNFDKNQKGVLKWLCELKPYRTLAYFIFCMVVTTVVYSILGGGVKLVSGENAALITALNIVIFQTVNFHHYIVDSMIWKARKKSHQKIMKISE